MFNGLLALLGPGDAVDPSGNRLIEGSERYIFGLILIVLGALLVWDPRIGLLPFIDSSEWITRLFNRFQFLKSHWWVSLFRVIGLCYSFWVSRFSFNSTFSNCTNNRLSTRPNLSFNPDPTVLDYRHAVNSRPSVGPVNFVR